MDLSEENLRHIVSYAKKAPCAGPLTGESGQYRFQGLSGARRFVVMGGGGVANLYDVFVQGKGLCTLSGSDIRIAYRGA